MQVTSLISTWMRCQYLGIWMPTEANRRATASYSSAVTPGLPLTMRSRWLIAHSRQRSKATGGLFPSAPATASGRAPASIALWMAIGCHKRSHLASADMTASSDSSSYWVRSSITSWQLALESANKSPKTVRAYTDSSRSLSRFLAAQGMPIDVEGVDAPHIRAYLLSEEQRTSPVSAAHQSWNIRVFFGWLASEGERENPNPMDHVEAPKVTKAFFTEEELT